MPATSRTPREPSLWTSRLTPRVTLALVIGLSLLARVAWLGAPCRDPCRSGRAHVLIFDETFYVNAARVIDGIPPPTGGPYGAAPAGQDPNAEHPQLVKLLMAATIRLLGDGPWGWRLVGLLAGTLALLGLFALVRAAGGSPALAVAATALMALDNLLLVGGRIATLDLPALAATLWGTALWLRGRPLGAGALLGLGACAKEVALLGLAVILVHEVASRGRRLRAGPLLGCLAAALGTFVALLWLMGLLAVPFDDAAHRSLGSDPLRHLGHILIYGAGQRSPDGPRGIASYPWAWLVDLKPIVYLNVDLAHPSPGLARVHPAVHFLGVISPPLLLAGLTRMLLGLRPRRRRSGVLALALAWFTATWTPFALASALASRTSYLYYMTAVMPALYLACADALASARTSQGRLRARVFWASLIVSAALLYPLTPLPSG